MERNLVKHGPSTLIISLPRKWVIKNNLKAGNSVFLQEKEEGLVVSPNKIEKEPKKIDVDFSGLDRTSIMFYLRALYREGYSEIKINFKNQSTIYYRLGKTLRVSSIILHEIQRLIGIEIIEQRKKYILLKQLAETKSEEFQPTFRRVFFLFNSMFKSIIEDLKTNDYESLSSIEEQHDNITKAISFCLRIIRVNHIEDEKHLFQKYHILMHLDVMLDILKYFCRSVIENHKKFDDKTLRIITSLYEIYYLYDSLFFKKINPDLVREWNEKEEKVREEINKLNKKQYQDIAYLVPLIEILRDLVETKLCMIDS
jgi:phosphate uptake regulator